MDRDYIDLLNRTYDDFYIYSPHNTPVLSIETDELDFVNRPQDLDLINNRIREELRMAPYQPKLPIS